MPYDSIGVIVLVVGDHAAPLYNIVSYNVYERLLGMELTPWSQRQNAIRLKNKAADKQARTKAGGGQVAGTHPSHPIKDYIGEFIYRENILKEISRHSDFLGRRFLRFIQDTIRVYPGPRREPIRVRNCECAECDA